LKYKEALSGKVLYLKSIYEILDENTTMIITSDSGKLIFIIKLVSRIVDKIKINFIRMIPKMNQGKFNEEIIQL